MDLPTGCRRFNNQSCARPWVCFRDDGFVQGFGERARRRACLVAAADEALGLALAHDGSGGTCLLSHAKCHSASSVEWSMSHTRIVRSLS
jgi:hypothetical protein